MKRIVTKALTAASLSGVLAASGGCLEHYRNVVDPCYPDRYECTARLEVLGAFGPQVQNGHVLDQTLWNYQFDEGSDKLNAQGYDRLDYLVRRRPAPDTHIFLATARDLKFDPTNPDAYTDARRDLDSRRIIAIQRYLAAQTAGRPMEFEVVVHDPQEVGQSAVSVYQSIGFYRASARGTLGASAFSTTTAGAGNQLAPPGTPANPYGTGGTPGAIPAPPGSPGAVPGPAPGGVPSQGNTPAGPNSGGP
jgi:hypothetical protein